jgi:hypothetical protein
VSVNAILCRPAKFSGVHSLDLHFKGNFGTNATTITFIGLKGEHVEVRGGLLSGLQMQYRTQECQHRIAHRSSMGLLGVARANTAVGVSPETFLLLLQSWVWSFYALRSKAATTVHTHWFKGSSILNLLNY